MTTIRSIITEEIFNRVSTILNDNKSYQSDLMEGSVRVRRWCEEHSYWTLKLHILIIEQKIILYEYIKVGSRRDSDYNIADCATYELADPQSMQKVFDKIKQALPGNNQSI